MYITNLHLCFFFNGNHLNSAYARVRVHEYDKNGNE